jgi:uncharacterized protein with GYD domain
VNLASERFTHPRTASGRRGFDVGSGFDAAVLRPAFRGERVTAVQRTVFRVGVEGSPMPTYAAHVSVEDRKFQNVQELASIWGEIRGDLEEFDVELIDTYAVLGGYDFLVLYEAPDRDTAFKTAITVESHGLDLETAEIASTEDFADLVDDTH